ncbi:MAG: sulfatase-like hydrolase/transferase [Phycisphaeraceae bacterium]|nr:sulfatase-like hydrolase/transferase [Phycisphaeraceae bacterium]
MTARPNILLITSDQQHFDTLGFANPLIQTPSLDRLAREGAHFTRAYCPNPLCSPTRASIITGLYPSAHGCWTLGTKLMENVPTLGQTLGGAGYQTSLVGKVHLQPLAATAEFSSIECQPILRDLEFWRKFTGPWYGFERVETARMHADESHAGQHYAIWMEEKGLRNWADYFYSVDGTPGPRALKPLPGYGWREPGAWPLPAEFHYSTWTAERTIAHMQAAKESGRPFLLWSSFHDPHPPYAVPEPWASIYDPARMPIGRYVEGEFAHMPPPYAMTRDPKANWAQFQEPGGHGVHGYHCHLIDEGLLRRSMAVYYGMISFMDQQIGRILKALDDLGMTENTLVVFTTDHGHYLGQHGLIAKGPFHYEDGVKLPFLVRWPGQVAAATTCGAMQSLVDLMPTFLQAAGVAVPRSMQGVSQLDVWQGKSAAARDHVLVENRHQPTKVHLRTYINERYKLTVYRQQPWGEFFDLRDDPQELHNRWDDPHYATKKAEVMQRFLQAEMQREIMSMPRIAGA